jgi:hypothetical protein
MQGRITTHKVNLCAKRVQCSSRNTQALCQASFQPEEPLECSGWNIEWKPFKCSDWNIQRVFQSEHIVNMFQPEHLC